MVPEVAKQVPIGTVYFLVLVSFPDWDRTMHVMSLFTALQMAALGVLGSASVVQSTAALNNKARQQWECMR
jgi:hypothetical protein